MLCYFNVAGAAYDPDTEGFEMASLAAARLEAVHFTAEYIRDRPEIVWMGDEVRVEVTNADQLILFTIMVLGVNSPSMANFK